MKTKVVFLLWLVLWLPRYGFSAPPEPRLAQARVQLIGGKVVQGYLFAVNDSSLQISRNWFIGTLSPNGRGLQKIEASTISKINLKGSHSVKAGAFMGSLLGGVLGGLIGVFVHKPCDPTPGFLGISDCTFEAVDGTGAFLIGGALGAIGGAGFGILIGNAGKTFPVSGSQQLFEQQKSKLLPYIPKVK